MSKTKTSMSHRFLAAVLSFVMVLSLVPFSTLSAFAATVDHPDAVTVSVKDENGNALSGATVAYNIDSATLGADYETGNKTTDSNGCVEVLAKDKYIAGDLTISATVTKADYVYADGNGAITNVAISSDDQDFSVQLKSTKITDVTITANSGLVYNGSPQRLISIAGDKDGDTISYKIDSGAESSNAEKTDAGTYSVEVTVKRTGYDDLIKTVSVTISKADIADIDIAAVEGLKYNEENQDLVILTGSFLGTDSVTWNVNGSDTGSQNIPQGMAIGSYTVKLTVDRGSNYKTFEKQVSVAIALGNIDLGDLNISANDRTYNTTAQDSLIVFNKGDYDLEYRLGDTGSWVVNDIPKITDAGSYNVYVRATKVNYEDQNIPAFPIVVTIAKADQSFGFDNYTGTSSNVELTGEVPYAQQYDFSATDTEALAGGTITYDVELDEEGIASIDDDGLLTVDYPGTIKVIATLSGNDNYNECIIEYTLDVSGAVSAQGQYISFDNANVDYTLGTSNTISEQTAKKNNNKIKGTISYELQSAVPGVSINKQNGTVTVSDYDALASEIRKSNGTLRITVTANKAKSGKYGADTASYRITLSFGTTPASSYTLPAVNGTNGWYISNVVVTPADGYIIAQTAAGTFGATTTFSNQGTDARYVYLKNTTTGAITDQILVDIKIDTVKPSTDDMNISYSESILGKVLSTITFGYYNPSVTVTFEAKDETSGLNHLDWTYTREANASTANLATETGTITFTDGKAELVLSGSDAKQYRGNLKFNVTDNAGNVSDDKSDTDHIIVVDTVAPNCVVSYMDPLSTISLGTKEQRYFDGDVELTFTVTETNFYEEEFVLKVSKDEGTVTTVTPTWTQSTETDNVYIGKYTLSGDGDYVVYATYKDRSNNAMADYESDIITIDTIAPVLNFEFNQAEQKTKITVTEHNFRAVDITATVIAKDVNGNTVTANNLTSELQGASWTKNGDIYTYETSNYVNGIYNITLDYEDLSKHTDKFIAAEFIIDHEKPTAPEITYSKSLVDTVLGVITLGFYNPSVDVTFTSYDNFSGVDYFTWSYTRQSGVSESNVASYTDANLSATQDLTDKSKYTATVTLPLNAAEQLRGSIATTATDTYNNVSDKVTDSGNVIVVDTVSPTMTVEYSEESNKVGTTLYYGIDKNGKAEVTFNVNEANFFSEDVVVKVAKNGGTATAVTPSWTDIDADKHVGKYTISGDGHYVVSVEYTDRSNNTMASYTSGMITLDTVKPVIDVSYRNTDKIDTLADKDENQRDYFDKTQTAVVTITEHNFNADDVQFNIIGNDVTGAELNINNLISKSAWSTNGDVHTITITYSGDANYTFDVDYTDLATNKADDYAADYFTVDTVAPTVTGVTYSTSVFETVLSSVSFGFYNAKMTVTITAEDDTAGVHKFDYSYLTAAGVSGVNAQLLDQAIEEAAIIYTNGGKTATMSFEIPKMVLGNDNQFNGTVKFDSIDRSGNKVEKAESKRIVVDNISPTSTITYNTPVNEANGISYYDGNINGTITINEANFYSDDVIVMVARDGGAAQILPTSWTDVSVDSHIGTFTLTDDADYVVTVNYTDKSGNVMAEYKSNQLTLDTKIEPATFTINGQEKSGDNGGAYKDDATIAFNFDDQNFDTQIIKLIRTRFNESKDVTADFVAVNLNDKGGAGSFDIPRNVETDGIYVLTVTMTDKAGHSTESNVKFTINRYGSVYEYSDYLVSLIKDGGQYITKNGDMAITDDLLITEYNADRIVKDSLKIVITRDGETIETKYTASPEASDTVDIGSSGWYQYLYTISKDNFTVDGVYNITLTSKDATANTSTSVPDNSIDKNGDKVLDTMSFTVDTTAPEIRNIINLDKKIVNAQELTVKYTIVDVGGLAQVEVIVNGQSAETITDFGDSRNNFSGEFNLSESNDEQTVQLKVTDLAGNITDTASDDFDPGELYVFNDKVTISTNLFVRWYANKPLFWGSIGGVVLVAAGIWVFIVAKRKKSEKSK